MKYKLNTTFEIWDFNNPEKELPKDLQRAIEELNIFQFIYFFTHIYDFDGYVSYPAGTQETMGGDEVFVFNIYRDTEEFDKFMAGEGDEPDGWEVAISQH